MASSRIRRTLHVFHAATSLALIGTGLLIQWPELRWAVVGGYGLQIARLHTEVGIAFVVAPVLAILLPMHALRRDLLRRLRPPDPMGWRRFHLLSSLLLSGLLGVSGVALWPSVGLELSWVDAAREAHIVVAWLFLVLLAAHLFSARRKIAGTVRMLLRRGPDPGLEFPGMDEEE